MKVTNPDTWNLASTDGNSHPCPTNNDCPVCFPLGDLASCRNSYMRIGRLVATLIDTDINHRLDSGVFFKVGFDDLFVIESGLVGSNSYCPRW
jgi:hypothetical protein